MTPMADKRALKPTKESTIAFIGLGANLGERDETIRSALAQIEGDANASTLLAVSTLRETDPVGNEDQPKFLNGAAMIATDLEADALLDYLLALELRLGRDRASSRRFGPRTIDLDLLLFGDETIDRPGLRVPHPRLHQRRFVLEPLAELDPALVVPGQGPVSTLLAGLE
jgi:2-amino-4-hydroxy-6-hydroxymethyldihydropteridine diphosphokinase